MRWNKHSALEGTHATLGASNYHWLNYDEDKMRATYENMLAKERGTRLHAFASEAIALGQRMPRTKTTLAMFVNDALGFKMQSEQPLFYSFNCYGTADAICFNGKTLRIHDLKTGVGPTHFEQLQIYAALFCLEYDVWPDDIEIILRIYQNDDMREEYGDPADIKYIMQKIKDFDKLIESMKGE